jgi:hypothetical protein
MQEYASAGFTFVNTPYLGYAWHSWLRYGAASQKIMGSIPDGVFGIFHRYNPSSCTLALGSIESLTEMSTRDIF